MLGDGVPILMVGDYNYPLFKGNLMERVNESGYDLSLSDRRTYTRYKFFRGHFDFVTSQGFTIDTLDLGGGFASHNTLHSQYLPGEESTPSLGQYVERIASGTEECFASSEPPRVVLETGRAPRHSCDR